MRPFDLRNSPSRRDALIGAGLSFGALWATLILPSAAVVYGQPSLDLTSRLVQKINSGAGK